MTLTEKQAAVEAYGYEVFEVLTQPGTFVVQDTPASCWNGTESARYPDDWSLAGPLEEILDEAIDMLKDCAVTGPLAMYAEA